MTRVAPLTAWLLGLLLGTLDGFLGFEFPSLALGLFGIGAILLARNTSRVPGLGGLLLGAGGLWAFVLLRAQASCAAFDAVPDQGCAAPDVTSFVLVATIAALVGIGLTLRATRRSR